MSTESFAVIEPRTSEADTRTETFDPDQLPTPVPYHPGGGFTGYSGSELIEIPWLSLVSGASKLAETFKAGSFVYNKEIEIGTQFRAVFLQIHTHCEETLPEGEDGPPHRWDNPREARASGLPWKAVGSIVLLIAAPLEGGDENLAKLARECWLEHDGVAYVPARFSVRGSRRSPFGGAYQTLASPLRRHFEHGALKGDLASATFTVFRTRDAFAGNTFFRPHPRELTPNPPELRELIRSELGF